MYLMISEFFKGVVEMIIFSSIITPDSAMDFPSWLIDFLIICSKF